MIPLSAVWAGPPVDEHFKAPPLFFARTEGSTPFRSLFTSVTSAIRWCCPTGAGKSVLLALMALQFRATRAHKSLLRLWRLDPGAALAMGGDWHDLGGALSEDASERSRYSRLL